MLYLTLLNSVSCHFDNGRLRQNGSGFWLFTCAEMAYDLRIGTAKSAAEKDTLCLLSPSDYR